MASQWNIPKIVTWRVKDWASCLLACKFPLDVDEDRVTNNSNKNLMFKKTKRKTTKNKKKRSERKLSLSPPGLTRHHFHLRNNGTRSSSVSPTTSASQKRRLSWPPPLSDDGFIVFCFDRDDGGFEVVKEDKQVKKDIEFSHEKSQKTVNRKLIYEDQGVKTKKNKSLEINGTKHDQNDNTSCPETEDLHQKNDEEVSEEIEVSSGSNGSSNSEGGRGSFAFPILGVEWMGSPVQMPKSDELSTKKPKPTALSFQCCRFS